MKEPQFYVVWREGSKPSTPTYKHARYGDALEECKRLTLIHGGSFHVLCHVATATKNDIQIEEVDSIPF